MAVVGSSYRSALLVVALTTSSSLVVGSVPSDWSDLDAADAELYLHRCFDSVFSGRYELSLTHGRVAESGEGVEGIEGAGDLLRRIRELEASSWCSESDAIRELVSRVLDEHEVLYSPTESAFTVAVTEEYQYQGVLDERAGSKFEYLRSPGQFLIDNRSLRDGHSQLSILEPNRIQLHTPESLLAPIPNKPQRAAEYGALDWKRLTGCATGDRGIVIVSSGPSGNENVLIDFAEESLRPLSAAKIDDARGLVVFSAYYFGPDDNSSETRIQRVDTVRRGHEFLSFSRYRIVTLAPEASIARLAVRPGSVVVDHRVNEAGKYFLTHTSQLPFDVREWVEPIGEEAGFKLTLPVVALATVVGSAVFLLLSRSKKDGLASSS